VGRGRLVLVVAIAVGLMDVGPAVPVGAAELSPRTCTRMPEPVARRDVPRDVEDWAQGHQVVGHGALWTERDLIPSPSFEWVDPGTGDRYGLKFPWYLRPARGDVPKITGRRVDGPGTFGAEAHPAYTDTVWVASGLEFSTGGCWKVVAEYRGSTLKFRVWVGPEPSP